MSGVWDINRGVIRGQDAWATWGRGRVRLIGGRGWKDVGGSGGEDVGGVECGWGDREGRAGVQGECGEDGLDEGGSEKRGHVWSFIQTTS